MKSAKKRLTNSKLTPFTLGCCRRYNDSVLPSVIYFFTVAKQGQSARGKKKNVEVGAGAAVAFHRDTQQVTTPVFVEQIGSQEYTQAHTYPGQISDDNARRKEGFGVTNETCLCSD